MPVDSSSHVLKPVQHLGITFLVDNTIEWLAESKEPRQLR